MAAIVPVIIFLIILAVLVFVHELGHFIAAKISGIRVDEFALGFPPKIASVRYGETKYALNLVPFGGYVKIFGENPDDESMHGADKHRSFVHKPKYIQAFVLVAGVTCNIIFAWLLISIGFMSGMPVPQDYATDAKIDNARVTIIMVDAKSPAAAAGLKTGDAILKLQSGPTAIEQFTIEDVQNFIGSHSNQPVELTYSRGSEVKTIAVTPELKPAAEKATMGVALEVLGTLKLPFFKALWAGAVLTKDVTVGTAVNIWKFLSEAVVGKAKLAEVSGPVGIASIVGDASQLGIIYLLSFAAFISINLAIINMIPFPALDGGRILFVLIEKIKGSPIKPQIANAINSVGFLLLIALMLLVTYHDIVKLVVKQ
jgi:regulator of sigma E protease